MLQICDYAISVYYGTAAILTNITPPSSSCRWGGGDNGYRGPYICRRRPRHHSCSVILIAKPWRPSTPSSCHRGPHCSSVPPPHRQTLAPIWGDPPPILLHHIARGKDRGGSHPSLSLVVLHLIIVCHQGDPPDLPPHLPSRSPPPEILPTDILSLHRPLPAATIIFIVNDKR